MADRETYQWEIELIDGSTLIVSKDGVPYISAGPPGYGRPPAGGTQVMHGDLQGDPAESKAAYIRHLPVTDDERAVRLIPWHQITSITYRSRAVKR